MKEGVEAVQRTSEVYGEEMYDELCGILETAAVADRVEALSSFIEKYETGSHDETGEEVLRRASMFLKIDRASAEISQLAA